jgi:hypothetical protein
VKLDRHQKVEDKITTLLNFFEPLTTKLPAADWISPRMFSEDVVIDPTKPLPMPPPPPARRTLGKPH